MWVKSDLIRCKEGKLNGVSIFRRTYFQIMQLYIHILLMASFLAIVKCVVLFAFYVDDIVSCYVDDMVAIIQDHVKSATKYY